MRNSTRLHLPGGVIAALVLLVATTGCELITGSARVGSLQVAVDQTTVQGRGLGPEISVDIDHYVIRGESTTGESFEVTSVESQVVIPGLHAGYWDVTVDAYNEGNVHLYTGTTVVLVEGGVSLPVIVSLVAVSGTGTLSVTMTWPGGEIANPAVDALLVPAAGDALPLTFAIAGAAASFSSSEIPSGYHTLITKLKEDDMIVAGAVEFVHIVHDHITNADFAFAEINAPGSLQVGVEVAPEFTESLAVTIDGGETTSPFGQDVALTGAVAGGPGNTVFTWYVNGTAVDAGVSQTIISGQVPGHYRVDLLVVTADGTDGGMATSWVEIAQPEL